VGESPRVTTRGNREHIAITRAETAGSEGGGIEREVQKIWALIKGKLRILASAGGSGIASLKGVG